MVDQKTTEECEIFQIFG